MVCTFLKVVNTSAVHAKCVYAKQLNFAYSDLVNLDIHYPLEHTRAKIVDAQCVCPPSKTCS